MTELKKYQIENKYLDEKLIPKFEDITPIGTQSDIIRAMGYGDLVSQQSFLIQAGNKLETFWEEVISFSATSYVPEGKQLYVEVASGERRQIDHLFEAPEEPNRLYYLESKTNLNFDTEKKPESNKKIQEVAKALKKKHKKEVIFSYFVPIIRKPTEQMDRDYKDMRIRGVEWLIAKTDCSLFTEDEFFKVFGEDISSIFYEKVVSLYKKT